MTNEEREIAWQQQFLDDMAKIGVKPLNRHSPPLPAPDRKYDPYSELEER